LVALRNRAANNTYVEVRWIMFPVAVTMIKEVRELILKTIQKIIAEVVKAQCMRTHYSM
jgi:hypothetical protein